MRSWTLQTAKFLLWESQKALDDQNWLCFIVIYPTDSFFSRGQFKPVNENIAKHEHISSMCLVRAHGYWTGFFCFTRDHRTMTYFTGGYTCQLNCSSFTPFKKGTPTNHKLIQKILTYIIVCASGNFQRSKVYPKSLSTALQQNCRDGTWAMVLMLYLLLCHIQMKGFMVSMSFWNRAVTFSSRTTTF